MNNSVFNFQKDPVDAALEVGLRDLWYPVCPAGFVKESPVSLRRFGYKIALWRDQAGVVHALEDHCPHRGAPLSMGVILGDRLACPYHGIEVRCDGTVTRVPGSPGCKLEGSRPARMFHAVEAAGAIFLYNATDPHIETPPGIQHPAWIGCGTPRTAPNSEKKTWPVPHCSPLRTARNIRGACRRIFRPRESKFCRNAQTL